MANRMLPPSIYHRMISFAREAFVQKRQGGPKEGGASRTGQVAFKPSTVQGAVFANSSKLSKIPRRILYKQPQRPSSQKQ